MCANEVNDIKFKVGDIVRGINERKNIRSAKVIQVYDETVRIKVIKHLRPRRTNTILLAFASELELIERQKKPECVAIVLRDGNTITMIDKTTGNKSSAKCSPNDGFVLGTGIKLAATRLYEDVPDAIMPVEQSLNLKICVIDTTSEVLTNGKIYEIKNGKFIADDGITYPRFRTLKSFKELGFYLRGHWNEPFGGRTLFIEVVE